MEYADRVFFLGAGASKQDRFPLTSELRHGIAWAIARDNARFQSLSEHLQYLYNVEASEFEAGEHRWERLKHGDQVERTSSVSDRMPDVTDLLSTLDWMIRDQSSFGPSQQTETAGERSSSRELAFVRDLVVQALCYCLGTYAGLDTATTNRAFLQGIEPGDALVTTNWDLLLDAARDERFGSAAEDYGTTGNVAIEGNTRAPEGNRPRLLKLHGSLIWRYCRPSGRSSAIHCPPTMSGSARFC